MKVIVLAAMLSLGLGRAGDVAVRAGFCHSSLVQRTAKAEELVFQQMVNPLPSTGWLSFDATDLNQVIADDFTLESQTDVTRIIAYGGYDQGRSALMEDVVVQIFSDVNGLPGSSVFSQSFSHPDDGFSGTIDVQPNGLSLPAGDYWLAVYELSDQSSSAVSPWFWILHDETLFGAPAHFTRDFESWNQAQNGELSLIETSMIFEIYGDTMTIEPPQAPTLPAPSFVTSANFYNNSENQLFCQFPDPNADGAFAGAGHLIWEISFTQNCDVLANIPIDAETYPFGVAVDHPTDGIYYIELRRVLVVNGKRDETSPPYLQPGPNSSNPSNETNPRYLLHVPKIGGGFKGIVRVSNPNPAEDALLNILAYDAAGNEVASVPMLVGPNDTKSFGIYEAPNDVIVDNIYFASMRDKLAFIEARELHSDLTDVQMTYYSLQSGVGAEVRAAKASEGDSVGLEFTINSGNPNNAYWDGVAVVNLDDSPANVWVVQKDSGGSVLGEHLLGNIQPDEKLLSVISDLFPFVPYAQYSIESRNGVYIQVLGLNGSVDNVVLKETKINKKK